MAMISIVLIRDSLYSPRKALDNFSGACPVTDRRCICNSCFIGLNSHFSLKEIKKSVYFIQQWDFPYLTIKLLSIINSVHLRLSKSICSNWLYGFG